MWCYQADIMFSILCKSQLYLVMMMMIIMTIDIVC